MPLGSVCVRARTGTETYLWLLLYWCIETVSKIRGNADTADTHTEREIPCVHEQLWRIGQRESCLWMVMRDKIIEERRVSLTSINYYFSFMSSAYESKRIFFVYLFGQKLKSKFYLISFNRCNQQCENETKIHSMWQKQQQQRQSKRN